jgi:hypothetical protein
MKQTENLEQLLTRFTKRIAQIKEQKQIDKTVVRKAAEKAEKNPPIFPDDNT